MGSNKTDQFVVDESIRKRESLSCPITNCVYTLSILGQSGEAPFGICYINVNQLVYRED